MEPLSLTIWIAIPAICWLAALRYLDRYRPEPLYLILLAYLLGFPAAWLGGALYDLTIACGLPNDPFALARESRVGFFAYVLLVVGPIEELAKLVPFLLVFPWLRAFDGKLDGFIYAGAVGLGFASYENLTYVPALPTAVAAGRSIASPLIHALFAGIWGHACACARVDGRGIWGPTLAWLAASALLHGLYDFCATDPDLTWLGALIVLGACLTSLARIHVYQEEVFGELMWQRFGAPETRWIEARREGLVRTATRMIEATRRRTIPATRAVL